jgi:hypothetical protein
VLCDAPCVSWCVDDLLTTEARVFLDDVGVMGEKASLMGEVGESRSLEPLASFVRFFFRNPRVGIEAAVKECDRTLALPTELHEAAGTYGSGAECSAQAQWRSNSYGLRASGDQESGGMHRVWVRMIAV